MSSEENYDDPPSHLPNQEAIYIGHVVSGSPEIEDSDAYYIHPKHTVLLGSYEHGSFTPEFSVDSESGVMSACVKAFADLDATVELSCVGNALIDAHSLADTGILGDEQAHVYALREIHGFERGEAVTILNANPSTVDSHLRHARQNARSARIFVEQTEEMRTESAA
jgi:hypothetical protein